jgi:hypothetical protein
LALRKPSSAKSAELTQPVRTSSDGSALASANLSVRDGAVVSLTSAAVLLLEQSGHHVDATLQA